MAIGFRRILRRSRDGRAAVSLLAALCDWQHRTGASRSQRLQIHIQVERMGGNDSAERDLGARGSVHGGRHVDENNWCAASFVSSHKQPNNRSRRSRLFLRLSADGNLFVESTDKKPPTIFNQLFIGGRSISRVVSANTKTVFMRYFRFISS